MDYLKDQLIAYIGNKRRLLPFLESVIERLDTKKNGFLDLFAGSSSVSRLAKKLGFSVYSNDWEFYSYVINKAYIETDLNEIDILFSDFGGIDNLLNYLNSLDKPKEPYISLYYAPLSDNPDPNRERMFYTRENALRIDAIRDWIEDNFKEWNKEKFILVAILLYEAATHTNTSGVFKAYHNGFGGHGKDALSRILSPIRLEKPVFYPNIDGKEYKVFKEDANRLVSTLDWEKIEITYIDPPYNQHQYGSNYHLLNTIALWDKPYISNDFNETGKSGIRKDWVKTKSDYCIKNRASLVFRDLINNIRSRYILISYNTEGIVPIEELIDILREKGQVQVYSNYYVKYRGGRQSIERKIRNIEFLIVVDTTKDFDDRMIDNLNSIIYRKKIETLIDMCLDVEKLEKKGWKRFLGYLQKDKCRIFLENDIIIKEIEGIVEKVSLDEINDAILSRDKEIKRLISINPSFYKDRIINSLNKLNHRKYKEVFTEALDVVKKFFNYDKRLDRVIDIAKKRKVI